MSVKSYWYVNYYKQIYAASPAYGGWQTTGGDTFKIMLTGPAYVPNQDTQAVKNDVVGEVVGQGYNPGGQVLTNKTISVATGALVLGADAVTWTNCIFQATRAVIYDDTNTSPLSKQLVRWVEFGQTLELNNQSLTLTFDGQGNVDVITTPPPPPEESDPPQLVSAEVNISTLVLTYNEILDTTSTPATSSYIVRVNGTAQAAPSAVVVGTTTVTLTTAAPIIGGQTITLDYAAPTVGPVQDVSGNNALSFLNFTVQNTTVIPLVDDAAFVSQSVPSTMTTNTPYNVSVVMNNNGTTSWTMGSYLLFSANPFNNNTWGVITVPLPQIVTPGSNCTFNFSVQSPTLAGNYNFQWKMFTSPNDFGDPSTNVVVTVSPPVPPPSPTLTVQSPNGVENWVNGTVQTIRWVTNNVTNPSTVRIELSVNSGSTYTTLFTGVSNTGSKAWTVAGAVNVTSKIRITSETQTVATDVSDTVFAISDPPIPPPPEPTAPVLSAFIAVNPTSVTWTNTNVANETGYEYETAFLLAGPYTVRGNTGIDNTSFTWLGANPSTTYFGRVSSIGPSQTRYPSNVIQASTPAPPPPEPVAPTLISVNAPDSTSITWIHNNVANETGYDYESGPAAIGPWTLRGTTAANSTNFTWLGAVQSTLYFMRVSSIGASGTRYPSNVLSVTTPATPPPPPPPEPVAPVLGSVSAPTPTSLVWNHNNVTDEDGYEYYTSPTGLGTWTLRGTNPPNSTTFTWSAATASTTYDMRVSSFGAAGTRYPSNTLTVTTPTPPPPEPVAPTLSTLTSPLSTSLVWTHTNVANETGYEYSTSPNGTSSWTVRGTSVANSTTFTWTQATPNTLYFARVASIGTSGTRYQSNVLSTTTLPTPTATLTVVAPNGTPTVENWLVGSVQTIRWNSANLGSDTIKVELTRDAGSTYATLFPALTNDGSENWTVTQPTGTQNRVRISGVTNSTVTDSSNANFTISIQTSGNTYFVSTTGNDSNTGTQASPFRTIAKGLSLMHPGDTLYIRGGTYLEGINSNVQTLPVGSSFSNAPLISGYQSESVILKPSAQGVVNCGHSYVQYMIFNSLILDGINTTDDSIFQCYGGANHIRLQNSELKNQRLNGIHTAWGNGNSGTNFNEFLNLKIHDIGTTGTGYGIYMETSSNTVDGCEFYNMPRYGIHCYNGRYPTEYANSNVFRNNRIHNTGQNAAQYSASILISSGSGNTAYNNLIYSNRRGIQIYGTSTNGTAYFNTIFQNIFQGFVVDSGSNSAVIRDNIIYLNGDAAILDNAVGTTKDHNLTSNPLFVDSTNANFHLLAGSSAINAGLAVTGITTDFDGVTRGNPPDIGAYEFV